MGVGGCWLEWEWIGRLVVGESIGGWVGRGSAGRCGWVGRCGQVAVFRCVTVDCLAHWCRRVPPP